MIQMAGSLDGISSEFEKNTIALPRLLESSRIFDQFKLLTGNCFDSIDAADLGFVDCQQLLQVFRD
jgi:enoyl-CoA hydratase/carnithine racemase